MWNIIQCAVKGRSHEKVNMPCQDKTYALFENDVQTIALADGAGSAKLSHFGAETVTRCICEEMVQKFDDYFNNEDGIPASLATWIPYDLSAGPALTLCKNTNSPSFSVAPT